MEAPEPLNKKRKNPSRESVKHAIKAAKEKAEKLQAEREAAKKLKESKKKPAAKHNHPSYYVMVKRAISNLSNGNKEAVSALRIKKYIETNFDVDSSSLRFKYYVKTALDNGTTQKKFRKLRGSYLLYDGKVRPTRNASKKESPEKKERKVKRQKKEGDGKERKAKKAVEKEEPKKKERKKKEVKEKKERKKKEDDGRKKKAAKNDGRAKKVRKPKNTGKEEEDTKEVAVERGGEVPNVFTTGVAFNTTEIPEIRADVKDIIDKLLTDDNIKVGIIANRGWKDDSYNLETLDFSDDGKQISEFVENAYGEGANWQAYYHQVLVEALNLPWANHKTKMLILIGNDGVGVVRDPSLANEIGKLSTLGVKVYAFHHSQLFLLETVLNELN